MTLEEFGKSTFTKNTQVTFRGKVYPVAAVDFEKKDNHICREDRRIYIPNHKRL